ncbi:translation initiation factor IF-2 [Candidatus Woesearchaeota archaeon CG10_big_fil_rev_8_21_14_0_10_37_12]|nr:MAG: translation initiation factor IF-2 [Candidatus Woesearchaeota archaeon CG10_big_fil_rev_8_21_14_0_10_37_12]
MIRQPIVAMMGHVDHGKTSLLDAIRGTAVAAKESGGITQAIGASIIPSETLKRVCGKLIEHIKLTIPGLLFIDTPGHAAFVNLRKRGGNLADIAIVVIDINEGFKPQTKESIEILKNSKTPFIIAANKVDLLGGWQTKGQGFLQEYAQQNERVQQLFETKLYEIVNLLYEQGIQADRFDRVSDYTKQIAIVPVSAKTRAGIPELLMVLTGLAQKYLEQNLRVTTGPAKGTILEVKEQKGLGTVLDVIIYDGQLHVNDKIAVATIDKIIETKIKALFQPSEKTEMREKNAKFKPVKQVSAATGVRVVAPGTSEALSGTPIIALTQDNEQAKQALKQEIEEIFIENDEEGVIIKADALGSLEALTTLLREKGIPVRKSGIGPITKKDISDAEATKEKYPLYGVILAFNIPKPEFPTSTHIIVNDVIYKIIEDYETWRDAQQLATETVALSTLVKPCKIQLLRGYVFRQNNPAIAGVAVLEGTLTSKTPLMKKDGTYLTTVKGIQIEQKNVDEAEKNKTPACSFPGITMGRQLQEGDILYSAISEEQFRQYKEYKQHLNEEQKNLLKEIAEIMRKNNPMWGV